MRSSRNQVLGTVAALAIGVSGLVIASSPVAGEASVPTSGAAANDSPISTTTVDVPLPPPSESIPFATCDGQVATIVVSPRGGVIQGTPGDDVIVGSNEADHIDGGGGRDVVCLLGGDDSFRGGGDGPDRVFTGFGDDFIQPDLGGSYIDSSEEEGNYGDTVSYENYTDPVHLNLGDGWARLGFSPERDTLIDVEHAIGGSGNDLMIGSGRRNVLSGGPGDDLVAAGFSNDPSRHGTTLRGGPGSDYLVGGDANDVLVGDERQGPHGDDRLVGYGGDDQLDGGGGDDRLQGGTGNDELMGGDGTNVIHGGSGADRVVNEGGDDAIAGGDGRDTVDHVRATQGVAIDLRQAEVTALGTDTFTGIEIFVGSRWDDILIGDDGANELRGGAGDDTISGGGGDDHLHGEPGSDTLDGGPGNDRLRGEYGNSTWNETGAVDDCDGGPGPDDRAFGCERVANVIGPR